MEPLDERIKNMTPQEREYAKHLGVKYAFELCAECKKRPGFIYCASAETNVEVRICHVCADLSMAGKAIMKKERERLALGPNPW